MIGISYSEKASFQQEGEESHSLAIAEVAVIHNTRLFCSLFSYLQYLSNYLYTVSPHHLTTERAHQLLQ